MVPHTTKTFLRGVGLCSTAWAYISKDIRCLKPSSGGSANARRHAESGLRSFAESSICTEKNKEASVHTVAQAEEAVFLPCDLFREKVAFLFLVGLWLVDPEGRSPIKALARIDAYLQSQH